jgi:hypothetical protein
MSSHSHRGPSVGETAGIGNMQEAQLQGLCCVLLDDLHHALICGDVGKALPCLRICRYFRQPVQSSFTHQRCRLPPRALPRPKKVECPHSLREGVS